MRGSYHFVWLLLLAAVCGSRKTRRTPLPNFERGSGAAQMALQLISKLKRKFQF